MMEYLNFPTPEQIHAIEMAARRERARVIAQMFRTAARKLKALIARGAAMLSGKPRSAHHGV
ncbi:MAG: hypothetical protein HY661_13240 [Betaproteobacteria bacterium]|nr:hypothetical protein [Betaproteobacteria bacterium]